MNVYSWGEFLKQDAAGNASASLFRLLTHLQEAPWVVRGRLTKFLTFSTCFTGSTAVLKICLSLNELLLTVYDVVNVSHTAGRACISFSDRIRWALRRQAAPHHRQCDCHVTWWRWCHRQAVRCQSVGRRPCPAADRRPCARGNATRRVFNPLMATLKPHSNGPLYNNTVIGTFAVDGWAVTVGTARKRLGGLRPRLVHSLLYQM